MAGVRANPRESSSTAKRDDPDLVRRLRALQDRRKIRFRHGRATLLPRCRAAAPQNSIIGGASLWVVGGKKPEESKGVAKFFTFLSQTSLQQELHEVTGYLPMTKAAYAATRGSGFYDKNPGREIPVIQMTAKPPTENSRGLRLGNQGQIRDIIAEELEAAFAGKQDAQIAMDDAVKRGNGLLRQFERNTQQ